MRGSARFVTALLVATLLSGCAIGPNYKRPDVAKPETFRGQAAAEAASFADAPWWEAFQDPTLKTLIQEALQKNYDVGIAAARVRQARASLMQARSDYFPSLDYNGSVSRSKVPFGAATGFGGGPAPQTSNFYAATMSMSWELDIWGRVRRSNEAARATLFATEDARRGVWLTLVSDLAQAYFELLALDVQLQIARNSTQAYQATYDLFLDRFNLGVASKLETARALGALGDAQATIPQLESEIVAKENQISILLGKAPGPIPRGKPMYAQPVTPAVPAGLPSALLERRPDLPGRGTTGGRQRPDRRREGGVLPQVQHHDVVRHGQSRGLGAHGWLCDDLGRGRHVQRAVVQRRPYAGQLSRVHRAMGAGTTSVRASGAHRAP